MQPSVNIKNIFRLRYASALFIFISGQFISVLGTQISMVILPWILIKELGQPEFVGLLFFARMLPQVVAGPLVAVWTQNISVKKLLVFSQVLQGACQVTIVLLWVLGHLGVTIMLLLVLFQSIFNTPFQMTRASVIRNIADDGGPSVTTSNSLLQSSLQAANIIGPAIAAFIIAISKVSLISLILIDSFTFLLSACLIAFGKFPKVDSVSTKGSNFFKDIKEGFLYSAKNKVIFALLLPGFFGSLIYFPILQVILPLYLNSSLESNGASIYGAVLTSLACGALIGSFLFGFIRKKIKINYLFCISFTGYLLPFWLMVIFPSKTGILISAFIVGIFSGPAMITITSIVQTSIKREFVTRVFSIQNMTISLAVLLGYLFSGWAANVYPVENVLIILLLVGFIGIILSWRFIKINID
ncbi:MFS transporter [Bacillus chungangensis]|uniref:MFS family permease n=1 Tax=Bacillus chungangensis TaxID=587633 RepID=A0ABT9WQJ3_9BACI|nr:MFS transporter [Bacillus chungangensis]MDQ0175428.1 MFS family permease [Bacillus chungangensis]